MECDMSKTSIEEHAKWVKRLFEVSQLLTKTAQETLSRGYPPKFDTERAKLDFAHQAA